MLRDAPRLCWAFAVVAQTVEGFSFVGEHRGDISLIGNLLDDVTRCDNHIMELMAELATRCHPFDTC